VLFFIDVVVGTLLHRMGMTGEPMVDADVDALVEMVLRTSMTRVRRRAANPGPIANSASRSRRQVARTRTGFPPVVASARIRHTA
jgi:hypothetical protein